MRFSHTADCHIGGHRDPRLRRLTEEAFRTFVRQSIEDNVDFCIIAGDLFNTAIPGIESMKFTVTELSELKQRGIPVYAIPGSHDYSPSGKTILDVLERAGLLVNVYRGSVKDGRLHLEFTEDGTGVLLTGILGRRGMLDRELYRDLSVEDRPGEKIFLFHTAIEEMQSKTPGQPVSFLPEGFDYYAGGHVHVVKRYAAAGYPNVVYPGPLFPNSFSELEELRHGGYYLYDGDLHRKDIVLKDVLPLTVDVDGMTASEAKGRLHDACRRDAKDRIVLLRVQGRLAAGSPGELDIRAAVRTLEKDAYCVLRNTARLTSEEFQQQASRHDDPKDVEESLLEDHEEQLMLSGRDGLQLARDLMGALGREQKEGEKNYEYEESVTKHGLEIIERHIGKRL